MKDELLSNARRLIGATARALRAGGGEGAPEVLGRLACQDLSRARLRDVEPRRLAVTRFMGETVAAAMMVDAGVAAALAACAEHLQWRQSPAYSDALMGDGFMADYGWCEIVGPHGFFPGDDFLLGLLLLGPGRLYREHYHPAPELYWLLTGPSDWKRDASGFAMRQAGETIWHPPHTIHAVNARETPLLAAWCWTRDTGVPAALAAA